MKDNIKKYKSYIIIAVVVLLIIAVGFTAAYFQAQIGNGATANVTATTKTTDLLTFSKGNDINITATQANFYSGAGNRTGSTTATATLLANNDTNSATQTYNVYFNITGNNFEYTTSPTNTPELLLTVTNPSNQAVTSISGLTYTTVNGVSGFDITTKTGLIQIASNYTITSTGTKTDTWNITVTLINLSSDQQANTDKAFTGQVIIQQDVFEEPAVYWNDNFNRSYYSFPNVPITNYTMLDQLKSNYSLFTSRPFYIKTSNEHKVCVSLNNNEFCMGLSYWENGSNAMQRLRSDLTAAFGPIGNCYSTFGSTSCSFSNNDYSCYVGDNAVGCSKDEGTKTVGCTVIFSSGARCSVDS